MSTMTTARHSGSRVKRYPPRSFYGKLRKRGIVGAFAAVIGSGWFIYEIVHFVLVDHYHLPDRLNDIAIVGILCALFCVMTWRWFRGEKRKRRIKWELVLIPVFVLVAAVIEGKLLLHLRSDNKESGGAVIKETAWKNSLAILPFVNMSADQEQEYFCDGLTEELITKLSQIQELKVAARTSAFVFKGKSLDIRDVGQKLRVENLLEGSVRKSGSRVRISAQLINVEDGFHLWSETYDRDVEDIFAVQDEIARSVAGTLQVTLMGERGAVAETKNSEAYNAFLMGNFFYRQQTRENLEKSIGYYEEAIKLDPGFARAWTGLGATYAFQAGNGYIPSKTGFDMAKSAVKKALALDKNLAFAHRVQGFIQMSCDWDWAAAEASYRTAISMEPGRGEVETAQLAVSQGRFEAAVALGRRAVELDPISVQPYATLALAYWYGGRLEEAVASYRKILELFPEIGAFHGMIGLVRLTQSSPQEALVAFDQVKEPIWRLPGMAMFYHTQGRLAESDAALAEYIEKYQAGGAYNVAQVYAFRGEADRAFEWLEKAYVQHDGGMFLCNVDPFLKNLRNDPRYRALQKKMRFPGLDSADSAGSKPPSRY
ncbi:MAG: tetratricopeptide repeat protein [Candidatus Aminicenantes bacterium]|nr:tetratricopeptide repeat protein [Candidatus Aminicenantes bacterium]